MLLDNYYKMCQVMVIGSNFSDTFFQNNVNHKPKYVDGNIAVIIANHTGTTYGYVCARHALWEPLYKGIKSQSTLTSTGDNRGYYSDIVLGTGNTAAQASDYKMESEITTNLGCTAVGYTVSDDCKRYTVTKTFQNTSEEGLIVKEIGFLVGIYGGNVLVAREVLAEPMTIEAGKVFNVSFTFDF